jgi:hypothetical protein
MEITRDNYEAYFLDYLEGNLDEKQVNDFIEFLQANPDLKEELQQAGLISLKTEEVIYEKKEMLYKEEYDREELFNHAAIGLLEGDLIEPERSRFMSFLQKNPGKQKEAALFEKTKQVPDQNIVLLKKNRLYRYTAPKTILLWTTRIAAVLALAFFIYRVVDYINPYYSGSETPFVVSVESENKKEKPESSNLPAKAEKKQDPVPEKERHAVPEKKAEPKSQPSKSLRETTTGRINHDQIAQARVPAEIPERMDSRNITLASSDIVALNLVPVKNNLHEVPQAMEEERLLGEVLKEKTGFSNLSLNKVTQAGLNLVASISREKFNYETNSEGQITELSFDSRLLAFSIPTKNE